MHGHSSCSVCLRDMQKLVKTCSYSSNPSTRVKKFSTVLLVQLRSARFTSQSTIDIIGQQQDAIANVRTTSQLLFSERDTSQLEPHAQTAYFQYQVPWALPLLIINIRQH